ncbi:class I SAM-dependent methyltransferase [Muriicola sp.]|uniref:class I SAM-dependent methyltransferase n=1 Tax=Muriicola sp. TaxID=2020856 RepID=UPI003C787DE2
MLKEYDQITAFHYAAYRPLLHSKILNEYFDENGKQNIGLDIGCGTGHSSVALAKYCHKVFGIDPSAEMLQKALLHPGVEYAPYDLKNLDFANDQFGIITFAGSLYYAKSQQLLNETVRVATSAAKILIYDFEIFLEEIFAKLEIDGDSKEQINYDHQITFSGLDEKNIKIEKAISKSVSVNISLSDLTHLLLSSKDNYSILVEFFGADDLFNKVSQKLWSVLNTENSSVRAMTYLTAYRVIK